MTETPVTPTLLSRLRQAGIECFLPGGTLPLNTTLEPPCSIKWMAAYHTLYIGAFSYAVSGFYFHASLGRYTSIGEQVQIGRGDHPTTWLSTSPALYLNGPLFDIGHDFPGAAAFHGFTPRLPAGATPTPLRQTIIGNDVYIGHGAFIRPGVHIGDGAIIGAHAVVVQDVPPYAVVAGSPATIRKFRVPLHLIGPLLDLAWWRFAPWQLAGIDITRPEPAIRELTKLLPSLQPYAPPPVSVRALADEIGSR